MDRHQVKVRINGQEKSFSGGKKAKNKGKKRGESKNFINPHPEKNDVLEEDLPLIIVDEMAAAAEKKEEEEFDWVLPKEPEKKETTKDTSYIEDLRNLKEDKSKKTRPAPLSKKKLAPPSFSKKLVLSIVMAIGIGTCLGLLILAIMNMSNTSLNPTQPVAGPVTEGKDTDVEENTGASGEQSVTLASQEVAVLQGGAFSTNEAANSMVQTFQEQGFSATTVGTDTIYVLVGIGKSVDGMKALGGMANEKGLKTYAKEFAIPEKTFTSLTAQDVTLLQEGQGLFKELIAAASLLLQGKAMEPSAIERMNGYYNNVANVKEEDLTDGPKQWKALISGAHRNIQDYQSSNDTKLLWDAQQKLLEATSFLY